MMINTLETQVPAKKRWAFCQISRNILRGKGMFTGDHPSYRNILSAIIDLYNEGGPIHECLQTLAEQLGTSKSTLSRVISYYRERHLLFCEEIGLFNSKNYILKITPNSEMIWQNNEELYGSYEEHMALAAAKKFEHQAFHNERESFQTETPPCQNETRPPYEPPQIETPPVKMTRTSNTITCNTTSRENKKEEEEETPALLASSPLCDQQKNDGKTHVPEEVVINPDDYNQEIWKLTKDVANRMRLPMSKELLDTVTFFQKTYPGLDIVFAANDAYRYQTQMKNAVTVEFFRGTCNRQAQFYHLLPSHQPTNGCAHPSSPVLSSPPPPAKPDRRILSGDEKLMEKLFAAEGFRVLTSSEQRERLKTRDQKIAYNDDFVAKMAVAVYYRKHGTLPAEVCA